MQELLWVLGAWAVISVGVGFGVLGGVRAKLVYTALWPLLVCAVLLDMLFLPYRVIRRYLRMRAAHRLFMRMQNASFGVDAQRAAVPDLRFELEDDGEVTERRKVH